MLDGDLKSHRSLWTVLASHQRYRPYVTELDIKSFERRVLSEGLPFLTQVLPRIGKALDSYLSTFEWSSVVGFSSRSVSCPNIGCDCGQPIAIPVFLGKAIERSLRGDSHAIDCVRQLTYMFYKLEVPYADGVVAATLEKFIKTDQDVGALHLAQNVEISEHIRKMRSYVYRVLAKTNPWDIRPSHSGGATACKTPNKDKYHRLRYSEKIDRYFPYDKYFFVSPSHLCDRLQELEESPAVDPRARICLVPKDSRGPRIISCEPAEHMYIQQGLMRKLYGIIETHDLTSGRVNFTDQTINRALAREGSVTGLLSTLDLSDASDRVSMELVRLVFPPEWVEAFEACRSESTVLPDKTEVKLNKFAPMGSACCFPVEALVFWASAVATTGHVNVFVYGDDIIVPAGDTHAVIQGLESIGLLVNRTKSYWQGNFRESCGGDFHLGVDVTPVRIRKDFGESSTSLSSTADLCNLLIAKFGSDDLRFLEVIQDACGYVFPRTELDVPLTVRLPYAAVNDVLFKRRKHKGKPEMVYPHFTADTPPYEGKVPEKVPVEAAAYQRYEHRILQECAVIEDDAHPPDWEELLRKLLSVGVEVKQEYGKTELIVISSEVRPGAYVVPSAIRKNWTWVWLGEPEPVLNARPKTGL